MMKPSIIRDEPTNNLQISEDTDEGNKSIAVLLHKPRQDNHEHFHIELDRTQAEALHQWLREYLERTSK